MGRGARGIGLRASHQAIHPILGLIAVAFFSIYTGLLLYYQPIHSWQLALYVTGDVSVSVPTFFAHPGVVALAYTLAAATLVIFLAVTVGGFP